MVEIITIEQAKAALKGDIKALILRQSDLKSGDPSKAGKDWTRRIYQLKDSSGEMPLTCWNDEIQKIEVGFTYEISNPWWKERDGKVELSLGQYAKVKKVTVDETPAPTETPAPAETPTKTSSVPFGSDEITLNKDLHYASWAFAVVEAHQGISR